MVLLETSGAGHGDARAYVQQTLAAPLQVALAALCRERPAEPVVWLAEFLLANKPAPRVLLQPQQQLLRVLETEGTRAEPHVTALMLRFAASFAGATLIDLEHKFKTMGSIKFKFDRFALSYQRQHRDLSHAEAERAILRLHTSAPGRPPDQIIVDSLRYTIQVPTEQYTEAVRVVRDELGGACGFERIDEKNFWFGEQLYRGINDVYAMPIHDEGAEASELFFEVQLHTPESIELKHRIHPMMKEVQSPQTVDQARIESLQAEMLALVAACPIPEGALGLPKEVIRPPWWQAQQRRS